MSQAGYVLTGGRSSRMGRDKALLPFRGGSLAGTVAVAVQAAAGNVTVVGDPERHAILGFPAIPDLFPGEGPLGAILTALTHTGAEWNLITACDMPELSAEFLAGLLETAQRSGTHVLLPHGPSGLPEPLCSVWRRDAGDTLRAAFDGGIRKVTDALAGLRTLYLPVLDLKPLQNVNTPQDWSGYAAG